MSRHANINLAEAVSDYATDPFSYSLFAFPWGQVGTPLECHTGPRRWQTNVLREIGDHLSNPATRFDPLRIAVASGHGAGKSSLIAMIAAWALDTMPDCRVVVTANTENQLLTKTMPELLKWRGLALTRDWFKTAAMSIASAERGHGHSWRLDAIPWSATSPEAFAGLHNAGRRIVLIFDEASNIADRIWEVAEGALTDEDTEIIWICVGNPTRNTGRFKECFHKFRNRWHCRHIDSRTVEGVNLQYLNGMVQDYGIDSDIVKIRVLGQFPSQSAMTFIGSDVVEAARIRAAPNEDLLSSDPIIFGLDHARFGTDSTVLAIRQGRDARSRPWRVWNRANSMEIASGVVELAAKYHPDAIFIDAGGPNAGGVIDRARQLMGDAADRVFEINFGSSLKGMEARWQGDTRVLVANKRAQMWTNMRAWLPRGMIPDQQLLADDLSVIEYSYNADNAIILEKKDHLRARGCASPDWGDALALTFAEEVMPRLPEYLNPDNYGSAKEYDRYAESAGRYR
jgi:hypothetical protein